MVVLRKEEDVVHSGPCNYSGKNGILTLTNKRLIFESKSGVFSKKTFTNLDVEIDGIENTRIEGFMGKKLFVTLKPGLTPRRYEFKSSNLEGWQELIMSTVVKFQNPKFEGQVGN